MAAAAQDHLDAAHVDLAVARELDRPALLLLVADLDLADAHREVDGPEIRSRRHQGGGSQRREGGHEEESAGPSHARITPAVRRRRKLKSGARAQRAWHMRHAVALPRSGRAVSG